MMRLTSCVALAVLIGCGPGPYDVVAPRKVDGSSGSPRISKVIDLGDYPNLPGPGGKLKGWDSDGQYVVGELVLIRGSSFGKQPTVNIGGRPAERLARTGDGGIVTRIPADVPTGAVEVEVSHPGGRGVTSIEIRRFGLVVQPGTGKVHVVAISRTGALEKHGVIALPGARAVAISHDGQAAYVAASATGTAANATLGVIAMTASGGPRLVNKLRLPVKELAFVVAAHRAPLAVVVGEGKLIPLALGSPRFPALHDAWPLGEHGTRVEAVQVAPEGKLLALLSGKGNAVVPIDLSTPAAPRAGAPVPLLPGERLPLVRDLAFSPDGRSLWVLSGENDESITAGEHPTQLTLTQVDGLQISLQKSVAITAARAPLALAAAHRESIVGGTTIRSTARKVAIAAASVERKLLSLIGKPGLPGAGALGDTTEVGQVVRTDLDGKGEAVWSSEGVVSDVEMTHDARWLVSAATRIQAAASSVSYEFGVLVTPVTGGKSRFVALGAAEAKAGLMARASLALTP